MTTVAGLPENGAVSLFRGFFIAPPNVDFRVYRAYVLSCTLGLGFHLAFIVLFWSVGVVPLALFNILSVVLWAAALWLMKRGRVVASFLCMVTEVTVHAVLAVYFVGGDLGFQYFLITLSVASFMLTGYRRQVTLLAILLAALFVGLYFYDQWHTPAYTLAPWLTNAFFIGNFVAAVFVMASPLAYYMGVLERTEAALAAEHVKSEALLHNVLPIVIADRLKQSTATIAERFDEVSVLFTDVCNFTGLSADCDPVELLDALNEVFNYFDTVIEKYGLEKIRTIGDNYMVASGAPIPRPDHAQALARAAVEMMEFPAYCPTSLARELRFRAGINSGPVVGGVIGHTKFHYDVWGDPVNIAARMESHGEPGKIQITHDFYKLIKDDFVCERRGRIEVKGKGEMETWFLVGAR
jgi:class 3 adenylate cyclase